MIVAYPVIQLDGSAFQGANCMAAGDAMEVNRATAHQRRPSAATIRNLTGDRSGGLNMTQVRDVDTRYYDHTPRLFMPILWTDLLAMSPDRGFGLSVGYQPIRYTGWDCFRHNFGDNHFIWINHRLANGFYGADPGADGRYAGCAKGYQTYPFDLLRRAAGALDLSGLGTSAYRPLGVGKAYILLAPKDVTPVPDPVTYVHTMEVTRSTLAIRNRPRLSSASTGAFKKGRHFASTKLMRHGGAYYANGIRRTDWVGFTRNGRTDWVKRAWVKVV